MFHFAALLSYIFIHIGFSLKSRTQFKKWNCIYTNLNSGKIGLCLFFTALVFYVPFRGLHFSWTSTDEDQVLLNGGLIYYFISMIDMFSVSAALMLIGYKCNKKLLYYIIPLWIILSTFIFAGARWRLVVLFYTTFSVYFLYPKIKKPNVLVVGALLLGVYFGFAIMDRARNYSRGLNVEVLNTMKFDDIKEGAQENSDVYTYSIQCMDLIAKSNERVYFTPIKVALLMPIPRSIYPQKPDAQWATENWPTSSEEQKELIENIGNYILLNEEVNKRIKNKYIDYKVVEYNRIIPQDLSLGTVMNTVDFDRFKNERKNYIVERQKAITKLVYENFKLAQVIIQKNN